MTPCQDTHYSSAAYVLYVFMGVVERKHPIARKPGTGISIEHIDQVFGRRLKTAVKGGRMISADDLYPAADD